MSLLDLPNELILQISTDLSWRDVLHLRGTTRRLGSLLSTQLIDKVAEDPIWCPRALFFACTGGGGPHPPPTLCSDEPSPQDPMPGTRGGDNPTVRRILTTLSRTERGYGNVLLQAVQTKNLHIVTTLLNNGADADCRGTTIQCTPLHFAAASGEVRLVAQLVGRSDVDPNTCNLFPYPSLLDPGKVQYGTPLFDAVHNGHNEVVRLLLNDPRLDLNLPCGGAVPRTPLHTAVAAGNVDVVRMLLADDRIDVNLGSLNMANWDAPLHTAAVGAGLPDGYRVLMMLLADRRVNVNARGLWGHTPLHIAIASGGYAAPKALLDRNDILINVQEDSGYTPLHTAVLCRRYAAVKALLHKRGIDTNLRNSSGETALELTGGRKRYKKIIELFLAHEARGRAAGGDHEASRA